MRRRRLIPAIRVWSCCRLGRMPRYLSFRFPLATIQEMIRSTDGR